MKIIDSSNRNEELEVGLAHQAEFDGDDSWEEFENNYRLNVCDQILYAIINNRVVGHLGIQDETIKAVYVDEAFRGQGVAKALYLRAFVLNDVIYSDDAREPIATEIWKKFQSLYPNKISYLPKKDQFVFKA